ncbi:hypothetical protein D3C86_2113800 [compost metagenome]
MLVVVANHRDIFGDTKIHLLDGTINPHSLDSIGRKDGRGFDGGCHDVFGGAVGLFYCKTTIDD